MENRTIQYGNLIINKNSFEHYLWTDCIEIDNLRKEINLNPVYQIISENTEKYIKDLLRFFILKLHHRDYSTNDENFEDTIVPFNSNLDSIWVLFLSHYDEYSSFMKRMSAHILNGEEIVLRRNFALLRHHKKFKEHNSKLNYKNRYGSLPDIEMNTGMLKRIESYFDGYDYWQGTYYNNGLCKNGLLVYALNNPDNFHYFIGTLAEHDQNDIESGTLVYTDGTKEEFRQGVLQDEQNDSENETDSNVDDDSSVSTYTE